MLTRAHRGRSIAWVILSLALAAPWTAIAVPNRAAIEGANRAQVVSWAPSNVFAALKGWLTNIWAEAGCIADPNGRCISEAPQSSGGTSGPTTDAGCIADPNGLCK